MNRRKFLPIIILVVLASILVVGAVLADDGAMFRRNISKTPMGETEEAAIGIMKFYVPAQTSEGLVEPAEYYDAAGALVDTRDYAKPLVALYVDGIEEEHEMSAFGGVGFGTRDTFVAHSLDDGGSWKRSNISNAAHLSSFNLKNGEAYPGDSVQAGFAVAGDRVFAAWLSKYCIGGTPAYTLDDEDDGTEDTRYIALDAFMDLPDGSLYLEDLFGVAGSQKSVDYTLQGFPEVGEVPYSCVWSARGTLELDDEGLYDIVWRKAERLTSGRRDANRIEVAGVAGAGFIAVWQEDPEGLRPGSGEGPGEGWSGAIVNAKTDVWYTHIGWEYFDLVCEEDAVDCELPITLDAYLDSGAETAPKAAIPMAIPVRVTDNEMCQDNTSIENPEDPYCYADFDFAEGSPTTAIEQDAQDASSDFCTNTLSWLNPGGMPKEVCVTTEDWPLMGRVGASRPRIGMHGYDSDGDLINDRAWVILGYEETKALGEGTAVDVTDFETIDVGKNLWYHSFDMEIPDIVNHGNILNQPAKDPSDASQETFYELINTAEILELGEYDYDFYETEIARRFSLISQDASSAGATGTVAFPLIKQGIINQGGPADIFGRRFVIPEVFDPQTDNPYVFENMACDEWAFDDGSNPFYPKGVCMQNPVNLSNFTPDDCGGSACATTQDLWVETDGVYSFDTGAFVKVTQWSSTDEDDQLYDQSWVNPYDVSKGHRGYMDGDFIMVLYAWSPNWKANAVGHDHYNLYVRRSFTGGDTWTTTPAILGGDGTSFYENFLDGTQVELTFGAGEYEQARNVSQLTGTRETILDPRYTPTIGSIVEQPAWDDGLKGYLYDQYLDDVRDPSKFYIVYETGDNTTVMEGEAVPLDLFYSRAYEWGDEYLLELINPENPDAVESFDWLEHDRDQLSGEASITANPYGNFMYAVWNQWQEDEHEEVYNSDIYFRRIMYIEDIEGVAYDGMPIASIAGSPPPYVDYDDELTFLGYAKDSDSNGEGIVEYRWVSDVDGVLGNERILQIPGSNLSLGYHTIIFSAKDNEGNWSAEATVRILVLEELFQTILPMVGN